MCIKKSIIDITGVSEETANYLLTLAGENFTNLPNANVLKRHKGITPKRAKQLEALKNMYAQAQADTYEKRTKITRSENAYQLLAPHLSHLTHECVYIIPMNPAGMVLGVEKISEGGMTGTVVDPRIVFRKLLEYRATRVILAHNHPSGNLKPSIQDIKLTEKIKSGGRLLDIELLDHIIVGANREHEVQKYYSFLDEGML